MMIRMLSRLSATRSLALLRQVVRPCVVASSAPVKNFSRLSATRSTALLRQVVRPCVVASSAPVKNFSLSTPVENRRKHGWDVTAWPFYTRYKELAGHSATPVFGTGLVVYLLGKEIYLINHETMLLMIISFVLYHLTALANPLGKYLDDHIQKDIDELRAGQTNKIIQFEADIAKAGVREVFQEDRHEYFEIRRNTGEMETEIDFRKRLQLVETEVKKRLDYQMDLQTLQLSIEEKHMAGWVEAQVLKSIGEEKEEDTLLECIKNLNVIASKHAVA